MSYPLSPIHPPRHVKSHRRWFFEPIWKQCRFPSEGAYHCYHWGVAICRLYVAEGASHPRYTQAVAAVAAFDEAQGRLAKAQQKVRDLLTVS